MELQSRIDIFYFLFVGTFAFFLMGGAIVYFFLLYRRRLHRQRLQLQEAEVSTRMEVLNNTIQQVEEERRRIAQDLHDEIGSLFSILSVKLGQIEPLLTFSQPGAKIIEDGRSLIDTGIRSVQRISYDIVPPMLAVHGLAIALEELCSRVGPSDLVDVSFESIEYLPELPETVSLSLYRIVQELLSNTIKHAEAKRIELRLDVEEDRLVLYYRDDGKGYNERETGLKRGAGLRNMEARAQLINAGIRFESEPGKGMRVVVSAPLNSESYANG
ncbi:MAG: sensor histidine kinase [Bacteroidetes bacterium]|nr:sensor histidine kinase [Bacteroidota bacterium]